MNKLSEFFKNHKKVVMISATVLALAVIGTVVMLTGGLWKAGDGEATALPASNIYPTARATADSVNTPPATSVPKTTAAAATKTTEKENTTTKPSTTTPSSTAPDGTVPFATAIAPDTPADYQAQWDAGYLVAIDNPDYNQETLNRNILGTTLTMITTVEQAFIHDFAEYKEASSLKQEQDWAAQEEAEQIVEAFNKEKGLTESTGDALKEAFVSNFIEEQYASGNLVDYPAQVMKNYAYKVLGFLRLLVCSWFNDKQTFDRFKEFVGDGSKKSLWLQMRKQARLIQTDEWLESMKEEAQKLMEER